jgi:hypothetical protein
VVQQRSTTYRGLEGAWYRGGQSLLYLSEAAEGAELREHIIATAAETAIYRADGGAKLSHLTVSPGGHWLAFAVASTPASREEVRVLQLRSAEARTIASVQQGGILGLEWTPDGEGVLVSVPGNPPALWRASLAGGKPQQLSARMERRDGIRLAPGGRQAAFTTGSEGSEVWVMELGDNK